MCYFDVSDVHIGRQNERLLPNPPISKVFELLPLRINTINWVPFCCSHDVFGHIGKCLSLSQNPFLSFLKNCGNKNTHLSWLWFNDNSLGHRELVQSPTCLNSGFTSAVLFSSTPSTTASAPINLEQKTIRTGHMLCGPGPFSCLTGQVHQHRPIPYFQTSFLG